MEDIKIINGPSNILQVGTNDGKLFNFKDVIKHTIKFNNDSNCYEIYFEYYDEGTLDSVYSTLIVPLNDLEIITCTSLHGDLIKE